MPAYALRLYLFGWLCICLVKPGLAQSADTLVTTLKQPVDSVKSVYLANPYIKDMSHYLTVRLAVSNYVEEFIQRIDGKKYHVAPNANTTMRISITYKAINFVGYQFAPNFFPGNGDRETKGKTKMHNFSFGFKVKQSFTELSYTKTKGYYLVNSKDFIPNPPQDSPYIILPNNRTHSFGGLTGYNFNKNFSQAAIVSQSERQLKSAGSLIPKLFYRYLMLDNGAGQKSNNFETMLGVGYHYTFVVKKQYYLALGATPAVGYIWTTIKTKLGDSEQKTKYNGLIYQLTGRAGVGYNGERVYAGGYLTFLGNRYQQANGIAINDNTKFFYQLFVGCRIVSPKMLSRNYNKVEKKANEELKKLEGKSIE